MMPHYHCHFATKRWVKQAYQIAILSVCMCSFFQRPNQFNGSSPDLAQTLYHWMLHNYANIQIAALKDIHYTTSARQSLISQGHILLYFNITVLAFNVTVHNSDQPRLFTKEKNTRKATSKTKITAWLAFARTDCKWR